MFIEPRSMSRACIGAALLAAYLSSTAAAEPVRWEHSSGGNGRFFEVVVMPSAINWTDARDAAVARTYLGYSGILACASYQRKDAFIRELAAATPGAFVLQPGGYSGPWLGGIQLPGSTEPAGGFTWIDGSAWTYTNWFRNEPNNGAGDVPHEEAVQLFSPAPLQVGTIQWNDLSSGDDMYWPVQSYVVEYIPAPPAVALLACAGLGAGRRRR